MSALRPRLARLVVVRVAAATLLLGLALAIEATPQGAQVFWLFLVLTYLIHTMAELCLSPIGLSMVSKLAAARDTGLAMGAWFLCTAIGNFVAGAVAAQASGGSMGGIAQYASTYTQIAIAGFAFGAVFMLLGFIVVYSQTGTFDITAMRGTAIPGVAVLLISTELEEVLDLSDRIVVMSRGRAVGEMQRGEVDLDRLGLLMGGATHE